MRRTAWATLATALVFACGAGEASNVANGCAAVRRGDTLSSISERCDVSERSILAANPGVEGSGDLEAGTTLRLQGSVGAGERIGAKLDDFAMETGDAMNRLGDQLGESAQSLLDKNPDLKSRLDRVGHGLGLTSGNATPAVSVTPQSGPAGSTVTISGTGFPYSIAVDIGAGAAGSAFETLQSTRTAADGTVDVHVKIPTWAGGDMSTIVFVVKPQERPAVRTERFRVVP